MNTSFLSLYASAPYRVGAMLVAGSLVLTGCQTTNSLQPSQVTATPAQAKDRVNAALKAQYRKATAYHSNIELDNRGKFTNIDPKTISPISSVYSYCEETHDAAYIKLLKQAEAAGLEIDDARYDTQRTNLKQTYIACDKNYRAWQQNQYDDYTDAEKEDVSPYYQDLFDRLEDNDTLMTKEEINNAKLANEYWYKPLSINVQGVYQPLAGKITMLPSVQYDTRNHHSSINQPVYLDAKSGNLYLWADNFAIFNAKLLDKKLGTQWKNKWLKLSLNDGSLPKGFGRTLIQAHMQANDTVRANSDVNGFKTISANTLASITPAIPTHQLRTMMQGNYVIAKTQNMAQYRQEQKDYSKAIYNALEKAYPELVAEAIDETNYAADIDATITETRADSDDYDDEYASENYDSSDYDDYNDEEQSVAQLITEKLDSKALAQALIRNLAHSGSDILEDETSSEAKATKVQTLYGFNKGGDLIWTHFHAPIKIISSDAVTGKDTTADILTTYSSIDRSQKDFPNLPENVQAPNAQNSVDIRDYLVALDNDKDNKPSMNSMSARLMSMMMMASSIRQ